MKKFVFFVCCFFFLINSSWALTITCPKVASPGEKVVVHIEENEFNGIKAKYDFSSEFMYQDMTLVSPWKSYYDGLSGFSVGNVNNQDKLSMDINLKVDMNTKTNVDYNLGLINIEGNNNEYKSVGIDNLSCSIRVVSNVDTLDSLVVEGLVLNPKFDKHITSYKGSTNSEKIVIKAKASDDNAKVEGDLGEKKLSLGNNTFVVKVTSVRGTVKEYKIYITRNVDKKSSDVTLKSLKLSSGKLDFNKNTFLYEVDVDYEVENIDVVAVANDKRAVVEIQKPDKLIVGDNNIRVIVTAEDGTKATYEIVVNRKNKLSNDATIKNLIIKNYDINFDSDVYEYELLIDNEDKLDIEVVLNDDRASYKIIGNKNLKDNSVIEIEVKAENGNILVYKVNVRKLGESNSNSILDYVGLIPIIGFIALIVIVLVVKVVKTKAIKN